MEIDEARKLLAASDVDDADGEPVHVPVGVLAKLKAEELPDGVRLGVGEQRDGTTYVDWSGVLIRTGQQVHAEIDLTWTRKYWYKPVNLEHYLDLVRRTVERRARDRGDVALVNHDDDGAYVQLVYRITGLPTSSLRTAYDAARQIEQELAEAAEAVSDEAGRIVALAAERADGWGEMPLADLVERVATAETSADKGTALEELTARLFETVQGLSTVGRIRTATEEIDVTVLNNSDDARLARESAIILVECKNWSSKCGKDELVLFKSKLDNRSERCSLGFLVSWNGFASTVTKEMLRGTRERTMIVPLDGSLIRAAVRDGNFGAMMLEAWQNAVML